MHIVGYEFRDGFIPQKGAKLNAEAVGKHLEMLREKFKGEITPADILEDAAHNNSPLHQYFEWSDTEAAKQFRLTQARSLIRSVVAIYREPERTRETVKVAAFTHIPEGETSHYRATHHALSQAQTRNVILEQAWRDLQGWRRRYRELKEFASLFEELDRLASELQLN
jgi:hypothetical protein